MKTIYLITLLFCLCACRTAKDRESSPFYPQSQPTAEKAASQDDYVPPIPAPQKPALGNTETSPKPNFVQRLFSKDKTKGPRKVKYKNVTYSVNQQTASGGSTIGANSQTGDDNRKAKESATNDQKPSNTAGQEASLEADLKGGADNTVKKGGLPWWFWVIAVVYGGMSLWKKSINPLRWV